MEHSLLSNALVYLAAAVLIVPIAKKLGLGAVLGYLLAGIAIGPWGFSFIGQVEDIFAFLRIRGCAAAVPDRPGA